MKGFRGKSLRLGVTQKRILLLLATGVVLGMCHSPRRYFKILEACRADWKTIGASGGRSIASLRDNGYVTYAKNRDGSIFVQLTSKGRKRAQGLLLETDTIRKPALWDKKWRVVAFDIPCSKNSARNALRHHLRRLGFTEVQKSVFVHPYPCKRIIDEVVRYYSIGECVTYMRVDEIDREMYLKKLFQLTKN